MNGQLALSRSLGDFDFKRRHSITQIQQAVSCEPDVVALNRNVKKDEFILICCDGVYDVLENEELVNVVYKRSAYTFAPYRCAEDVCDYALHKVNSTG